MGLGDLLSAASTTYNNVTGAGVADTKNGFATKDEAMQAARNKEGSEQIIQKDDGRFYLETVSESDVGKMEAVAEAARNAGSLKNAVEKGMVDKTAASEFDPRAVGFVKEGGWTSAYVDSAYSFKKSNVNRASTKKDPVVKASPSPTPAPIKASPSPTPAPIKVSPSPTPVKTLSKLEPVPVKLSPLPKPDIKPISIDIKPSITSPVSENTFPVTEAGLNAAIDKAKQYPNSLIAVAKVTLENGSDVYAVGDEILTIAKINKSEASDIVSGKSSRDNVLAIVINKDGGKSIVHATNEGSSLSNNTKTDMSNFYSDSSKNFVKSDDDMKVKFNSLIDKVENFDTSFLESEISIMKKDLIENENLKPKEKLELKNQIFELDKTLKIMTSMKAELSHKGLLSGKSGFESHALAILNRNKHSDGVKSHISVGLSSLEKIVDAVNSKDPSLIKDTLNYKAEDGSSLTDYVMDAQWITTYDMSFDGKNVKSLSGDGKVKAPTTSEMFNQAGLIGSKVLLNKLEANFSEDLAKIDGYPGKGNPKKLEKWMSENKDAISNLATEKNISVSRGDIVSAIGKENDLDLVKHLDSYKNISEAKVQIESIKSDLINEDMNDHIAVDITENFELQSSLKNTLNSYESAIQAVNSEKPDIFSQDDIDFINTFNHKVSYNEGSRFITKSDFERLSEIRTKLNDVSKSLDPNSNALSLINEAENNFVDSLDTDKIEADLKSSEDDLNKAMSSYMKIKNSQIEQMEALGADYQGPNEAEVTALSNFEAIFNSHVNADLEDGVVKTPLAIGFANGHRELQQKRDEALLNNDMDSYKRYADAEVKLLEIESDVSKKIIENPSSLPTIINDLVGTKIEGVDVFTEGSRQLMFKGYGTSITDSPEEQIDAFMKSSNKIIEDAQNLFEGAEFALEKAEPFLSTILNSNNLGSAFDYFKSDDSFSSSLIDSISASNKADDAMGIFNNNCGLCNLMLLSTGGTDPSQKAAEVEAQLALNKLRGEGIAANVEAMIQKGLDDLGSLDLEVDSNAAGKATADLLESFLSISKELGNLLSEARERANAVKGLDDSRIRDLDNISQRANGLTARWDKIKEKLSEKLNLSSEANKAISDKIDAIDKVIKLQSLGVSF